MHIGRSSLRLFLLETLQKNHQFIGYCEGHSVLQINYNPVDPISIHWIAILNRIKLFTQLYREAGGLNILANKGSHVCIEPVAILGTSR